MKILQPKNTKKTLFIASAAILLIIALIAVSTYYKVGPFASKIDDSINLDKPTNEQIDAGEAAKKQTIDQSSKQNSNTGSDPSPAPQPVEGSDKKSVAMEISAANQNDSTLQIRTFIQTITSTGKCDLLMKNAQNMTYTANVGVQALSSTSTCKGFDIPVDQLSPGIWTVTINFSNDTLTASTSKEITIK